MLCLSSCTDVDERLGQNYLASNQQYTIHTASFPLDSIDVEVPSDLSAFSQYRFIFGAIRDEDLGLSTHSCSFTLVPAVDTIDFGKPGTRKIRQFHFSGLLDTVSCASPSQQHILQNVNVYALTEPLDYDSPDQEPKHGTTRITDGIPVYNGSDSLSFNFSKEFGQYYIDNMTQYDVDSISRYVKKFPGIVISPDEPVGNGGRVNLFSLPIDVYNGYPYGSYALLKFSAEYEGKGVVDTSFVFYLGPMEIYDDIDQVTSTSSSKYPQLSLNHSVHESASKAGSAGKEFYFEGEHGLKPVIRAATLRKLMVDEVSKYGDPEDVTVSKATITLPYVVPEDWDDMDKYPTKLSPTCRIVYDKGEIAYAGITDISVSKENQGDINRSLCQYSPDITHHAQAIMKLKDTKKINNYDVWMIPYSTMQVSAHTESSSQSSEYSDYLRQLAYSSYYNNMYGGYNYYNYMMMAMAASQQTTSAQTESVTDLYNFYKAKFYGPKADKSHAPTFTITYLVRKH